MKNALRALATVADRRPRLAIATVTVFAILGAGLTAFGPLGVSTSRRALVSEDEPGQARLVEFFDRFGRPDAAVFVVQGGAPEGRRAVVRELMPRLSAIPELKDRVLGRLDLRLLAEVLALNHPRLLEGFGGVAKPGREHTRLTDVMGALTDRILKVLDGELEADGDEKDLARTVPLIRALDAALKGEPSSVALLGLAEGNGLASHGNLDDQGCLMAADGSHHLVVTFPELDSDEGSVMAPLVDRMREARDAALIAADRPGVRAELTGLPALATDELRLVGRGIRTTSLLATFGILLLLFFAFRSIRYTVLALLPLGAGVIITLGIVELLYDGLNLVTSSFVPVLMGLGIDLGVHLLYRYGEDRRAGKGERVAMRSALVHAGPGVATGTVTTAIAFLTTTTTDFTAFSELGVVTAIGLVVMLACAFLLIPPLARLWTGRGGPPVSPELPGAHATLVVVQRYPRAVLIAASALTIGAVVAFLPRGPDYNGRYFDFLPEHTESYRGLIALEEDGVMGPAIVNITAPGFPEGRALAERLRALPEIGAVHSPTDLLPPLDEVRLQALRDGVARLGEGAAGSLVPPGEPTAPEAVAKAARGLQDAFDELAFALEQGDRDPKSARDAATALAALRATLEDLPPAGRQVLAEIERDIVDVARRMVVTAGDVAARGAYAPTDLPPLFRLRYVSKDGQLLAMHAYPSGDIWDLKFAQRFHDAVLAVAPNASGLALDIVRHQELIIDGFVKAAVYAAVLIALMLLLVFRRVVDAALAMLPVALGFAWMIGFMKPVGLDFDVANLVALPLILGIGIDAGAHIVHRYRESCREEGGPAKLPELVRGTGAAVLVSFLTTMIGFGALMFADYRAMYSLGLLLVVGLGMCLVASVFVLPALLVLTGRAR